MASSRGIRIGFFLSLAIVVLASAAGRVYHERLEAAERTEAYSGEIARR